MRHSSPDSGYPVNPKQDKKKNFFLNPQHSYYHQIADQRREKYITIIRLQLISQNQEFGGKEITDSLLRKKLSTKDMSTHVFSVINMKEWYCQTNENWES